MGEQIGCRSVTAAVGSVTNAMRGRETLARAAIHAQVVPIGDRQGCGYGIRFPQSQRENALHLLGINRIPVRRLIEEGERRL